MWCLNGDLRWKSFPSDMSKQKWETEAFADYYSRLGSSEIRWRVDAKAMTCFALLCTPISRVVRLRRMILG